MSLYGTTKYGLRYLTQTLVEETRDTDILVGALSPGIVVTDLLTQQYETRPEEWERAKRIFNVLADRMETVAPWLVERILANDWMGVRIAWLTRWKMALRFFLASFRKQDLFSGRRSVREGAELVFSLTSRPWDCCHILLAPTFAL